MATKLVGKNYSTPDLVAKVTGKAKYAEDYRAEGMLFAKLLLSPMPHARVVRIDASAALAMPGVKAILTQDDLPPVAAGANLGEGIIASAYSERGLTMEPLYQGEPILAVAAVDELTAAEAIERIEIEYEPLPFVTDPVEALKPGSPDARTEGSVWVRVPVQPAAGSPAPAPGAPPPMVPEPQVIKWSAESFANAGEGHIPFDGMSPDEWTVGDVEAGFKSADLVLDETFIVPNTTHHCLETRSAMAYWQNGKLYMHCSTQSTMRTIAAVARWVGIEPKDVVIISEYTGGGFGSKGSSTVFTVIPALLSKKANAPVMMRVTREEEMYVGRARPAMHGRLKVGFRKDGRITAVDGIVVVDNGPYDVVSDGRSAGDHISLSYQPENMRWRWVSVLTNTPPRGAQRSPGGMQGCGVIEPIITKAARKLGIDHVAIHRLNSPEGKAVFGAKNAKGERVAVTSAFIKEAIDKGAELFNWEQRKANSGKRNGSKVRGVGMGVSAYSAGSLGFDGLFVIKPDGRMAVQSGIGNLGTESVFDCHRVAAELVGVPWEKVDVTWGNTAKNLPWTCSQGGSQTTHAMTRAAHAAGMDAVKKLKEIAAKELGGRPEDYEVADERVARKGGGRGMTLAQAAQRAIDLGGVYSGQELPENINAITKASAAALAGQGLMGVARDTYGRAGTSKSYVAGFAEVEVDVETGHYKVLEFLAVADCGTVINPRNLQAQINGGVMLGLSHAISSRWTFDQHYGIPMAKRLYQMRPPSILDAPASLRTHALDIPDPQTPVGARGIGEAPVGSGLVAVLNALTDALGDDMFHRAPVTADMILTAIEAGHATHERLTANT
jgi:CO/xanthine dehydrogenase Mo-binding subunit